MTTPDPLDANLAVTVYTDRRTARVTSVRYDCQACGWQHEGADGTAHREIAAQHPAACEAARQGDG